MMTETSKYSSWIMSQEAATIYKNLLFNNIVYDGWVKEYICKVLKINRCDIDDYNISFVKGEGVRISVWLK